MIDAACRGDGLLRPKARSRLGGATGTITAEAAGVHTAKGSGDEGGSTGTTDDGGGVVAGGGGACDEACINVGEVSSVD